MKKLAYLTSKSGGMISRMMNLDLPGSVYSNRPNPKLEARGFPITYFKDLKEVPSDFDVYFLSGFMKILPEEWLNSKTVINYHPGTQQYKGKDPQIRMLDDFDKGLITEAGGFVHLVDAGVDTGKVLYEFKLPIIKGDTVESLTQRLEGPAIDFLARYLKE